MTFIPLDVCLDKKITQNSVTHSINYIVNWHGQLY